MCKNKTTAIVLAAGSGKRMKSKEKKQFMELAGKPVLYYSLRTMQESDADEIIIVTSKEDVAYCEKLIRTYEFSKVVKVVEGGKERYDSVKAGLEYATGEFVLIHDGARPFVSAAKISELISCNKDGVILAVPVKDTIKIVNGDGKIIDNPDRETMYAAQTPQMFRTTLIKEAYELMGKDTNPGNVTDDAMVMQKYLKKDVAVIEGEYTNIKLTTPEDILFAKRYLEGK